MATYDHDLIWFEFAHRDSTVLGSWQSEVGLPTFSFHSSWHLLALVQPDHSIMEHHNEAMHTESFSDGADPLRDHAALCITKLSATGTLCHPLTMSRESASPSDGQSDRAFDGNVCATDWTPKPISFDGRCASPLVLGNWPEGVDRSGS